MIQEEVLTCGTDPETDLQKRVLGLLLLIPQGLDKLELLPHLRPICLTLALMSELSADVFFCEKVRPRFNLTNAESIRYLREIRRLRRDGLDHLEDHLQYSANFDGLIDLVECENECVFLIKEETDLVMRKESRLNGLRMIPPSKTNLPFLLPQGDEVIKYYKLYRMMSSEAVDGGLYDSLLEYYQSLIELPHPGAYHVMVSWTLSTYLLEKSDYSGFIYFQGTPGRGKTRAGKSMIYVAYRGLHIETLSAAHLIRATRDLNATLFVDVRDAVRKMASGRSGDMVLLRIERGATVPRILHPGKGSFRDTEFFPVFGATVLASNEPVDDIVFGRTIAIQMPSTSKTFPMPTPEAGIALKERLDAFRAFHLGKQLPECVNVFHGRMGDITKPLIRMVRLAKPECEHLLLEFLTHVEEQQSLQRLETIEARIIQAVCDLSGQVKNGRLPVKAIHKRLNEGRDCRSQIDPSLIGRKLGDLGFSKAKTSNGCIAILWDTAHLQAVAAGYGLSPVLPVYPEMRSAVGFLKTLENF